MVTASEQAVDRFSEGQIERGDSAQIMGAEANGDVGIHIAPVGMVIHRFGDQGHLCHEAPGAHKIAELEAALQLAIHQLPVGERLVDVQQLIRAEQSGGHGSDPGGFSLVDLMGSVEKPRTCFLT